LIPFDGRSDYVGFIEHGIPGGGVAAGAEKDNAANGDVLDKCYHQLCDDLSNIAWDAFLVNTQLIAHSVATYGADLSEFPKRDVKAANAEMMSTFPYRGDKLIL
jgi:aminopeptidase Y